RTPLSLIRLANSAVLEHDGEQMSADSRIAMGSIETSVGRLLRLIDELLMLAAGQGGQLRLKPEAFDVALLLRRVVLAWQAAASVRLQKLTFDGPEHFISEGDGDALERIATNLVSNAIKFTPDGGDIAVGLRVASDGRFYEVTVSDTGVGIDE